MQKEKTKFLLQSFWLNLLFLLCGFSSYSQEKIGIQGIVTDKSGKPIADVMITRNWENRGLLSHSDGSFYLMAIPQDTLVFSHTSFVPKVLTLSGVSSSDTLKIKLTERTIELGEVHIINLGTWNEFKQKIATMNGDSIRDTDDYRLEMMFGAKKRNPIKNPYYRGQKEPKINPLTVLGGLISENLPQMLYNKYSRTEKLRRKIQAEKLREIAIKNNSYRYSEEILQKMFHLEGDSLEMFKKYCDYNLRFSQSDVELLQQTKDLYKKWYNNSDSIPK